LVTDFSHHGEAGGTSVPAVPSFENHNNAAEQHWLPISHTAARPRGTSVMAAPCWELLKITAMLRSSAGATDFPHRSEAAGYVGACCTTYLSLSEKGAWGRRIIQDPSPRHSALVLNTEAAAGLKPESQQIIQKP